MIARTSRGIPAGIAVAEIGNWVLAKKAENLYKVWAKDPINGKANYVFATKNGLLDTHAALDVSKIREERPELFQSIKEYFEEQRQGVAVNEADPYGDLALSRKHKLTPEQNWKRGLLQMRRMEFERVAVEAESAWEAGIRMLWAANFGTKVSDSTLMEALQWITYRQTGVELKALLDLEQDYYSGKLGTWASKVLESRLASLGGEMDFENVEEENERLDEHDIEQTGSGAEQSGNAEADPLSAFY